MEVYSSISFEEAVKNNAYPGRGIIVGMSGNAENAVAAYFIMGRSANSRNRVFAEVNGEVFTEPYDVSKVEDPSLIIYSAIRQYENHLIVSNGNQTDTIYDGLETGKSFYESLKSRCFEPDAPNLTPRISAELRFADDGSFDYSMSILKSADADGSACNRYGFDYEAIAGLGHFIHTYQCDGNPLPTFCGEPKRLNIPDDIDEFAEHIWMSLNYDNKISLYVRYINLIDGNVENRLFNKNGRKK